MPAPARAATAFWGDRAAAARIVLLNGPGSVGKSCLAGLARAEWRVHECVAHDLMIDTGDLSPERAARRIVALAGL